MKELSNCSGKKKMFFVPLQFILTKKYLQSSDIIRIIKNNHIWKIAFLLKKDSDNRTFKIPTDI
jgi:hypothetical protein